MRSRAVARPPVNRWPGKAHVRLLGLLLALVALLPVSPPDTLSAPAAAPKLYPLAGGRVISGDTLNISLDGRRTAVKILGIRAEAPNTPCGVEAATALRRLLEGGLTLVAIGPARHDDEGRRLLAARTPDGGSVASALARAGVARGDRRGPNVREVAIAEASARAARRGCLWAGPRRAAESASSATTVPLRRAPAQAHTAAAPDDFIQDVVARGLTSPTAFAFLPDGRILIAEKQGVVRLFVDGRLLDQPVLDIADQVNDYWDRGLLGATLDPQFATNGHVYLFFTFETDRTDYAGPKTSRVARYTMLGNRAERSSERVILGGAGTQPCGQLPRGADCLPADGPSHGGGDLAFAPDGSLFVTTGDATPWTRVDERALRSQDLDSLAGKLLRVGPDGAGLVGNPFWTGDSAAPRSKVWAYGFRNPFRMALRPSTGTPYLGNVGWNSWEAIDAARPGMNFGWPCYEGPMRLDGFAGFATCQAIFADGPTAVSPPIYAYAHSLESSAAVIGGAFYSGTAFPAQFHGAYFFGDVTRDTIRYLLIDGSDREVLSSHDFTTGADGPVAFRQGPDDALYYLSIYAGELRRISYALSVGKAGCPGGQFLAEYFDGPDPVGQPAFRRCESGINQSWGSSGPGGGLSAETFSGTWSGRLTTGAGSHLISVDAVDGVRVALDGVTIIDRLPARGAVHDEHVVDLTAGQHDLRVDYRHVSGPAAIRLTWDLLASGSKPPNLTIESPLAGTTYQVGDVLTMRGRAIDSVNGTTIPGSQQAWTILLHHCPDTTCHAHTLASVSGGTGSFPVPDHGDDSYIELRYTAWSGPGVTGRETISVHPEMTELSIATSPPGREIVVGDRVLPTPLKVKSVIGSRRTVLAPSPQEGLLFDAWSDGGDQRHDVTVRPAPETLIASFVRAFEINGSAVSDGSSISIETTVSSRLAADVQVYLYIFGPSGDRVLTEILDPRLDIRGSPRSYRTVWRPEPSLPGGLYEVVLAMFAPDSGELISWNANVTTFQLAGIALPADGWQRVYAPFTPRRDAP